MGIWEKLRLEPDCHRVVALVGAGGKTSTLFALAREARAAGLTAIVTTTTHIRPHPRLPLTGETDGEKLRALVDAQGVVLCGRREPTGKLTLAAAVETCRRAADVVLVEADGAKMLPLKAPAEHEPAIPPCADAVVAVAGLDGVGQAVEAACHRPERVRALLGAGEGHLLTPADVAALLAHPQGGRKGVAEGMAFRCLLNKADTPARRQYAREAAALPPGGLRAPFTAIPRRSVAGYAGFDQGGRGSGHGHGGAAAPGGL